MTLSALILGDIFILAAVTLVGFAAHGAAEMSSLPRMAASFMPLSFAWFLLAPWFGLFDKTVISNQKNLLRIPLVFLFAAPLAAIVRSAILGIPAIPLFALILGGTNALGMILWRWINVFTAKSHKAVK